MKSKISYRTIPQSLCDSSLYTREPLAQGHSALSFYLFFAHWQSLYRTPPLWRGFRFTTNGCCKVIATAVFPSMSKSRPTYVHSSLFLPIPMILLMIGAMNAGGCIRTIFIKIPLPHFFKSNSIPATTNTAEPINAQNGAGSKNESNSPAPKQTAAPTTSFPLSKQHISCHPHVLFLLKVYARLGKSVHGGNTCAASVI